MLDKIMGNKGMVKEIQRDGKKVWSMPRIKLEVDDVYLGSYSINIKVYPNQSIVKAYVNNKQVNTVEQSAFGTLSIGLRDQLKDGDNVIVKATHPGWSATQFDETVS